MNSEEATSDKVAPGNADSDSQATGHLAWHKSGWPTFPLPARKKMPPPTGRTGNNGVDATLDEIQEWEATREDQNVGLRAPVGVVGLDVDDYEDKPGARTLKALEASLGPLPATWRTRGRRTGVTGIRWYRVPEGTVTAGVAGPGIEMIQHHHRYALVWPSIHPSGLECQTLTPEGIVHNGPLPNPADLPELPEAWVTALEDRSPVKKAKRGRPRKPHDMDQEDWLLTLNAREAEPCIRADRALEKAHTRIMDGDARHDSIRDLIWELVALGAEGHGGIAVALQAAEDLFTTATAGEDRDPFEVYRLVSGAIREHGPLPAGVLDPCMSTDVPPVRVDNPALAAAWLRDELGTGPLSGVFIRSGWQLVHTPRVGEEGYVAPSTSDEDDGPAQVRPLSPGALAARVDVSYPLRILNRSDQLVPALFPRESAQRVHDSVESAPNLRPLLGVTHTPILRPDGSILSDPGYDEGTGVLYLPEPGLTVPPIPDLLRGKDVREARSLLLEMIQDFPFTSEAHRANFLGLLLTPVLRGMLPPPYQLGVFSAPMPGSGKGFLTRIIRDIHGGVFRGDMPYGEAELKKSIMATLMTTTAPVVQFDNVTGTLKSPTLDALLTTDTWSDRVLGVTEEKSYRNDRLWLVTGNNAKIGGDLYRRSVYVEVSPQNARPWERDQFAIPDLREWVLTRRGELIRALLVLAQAWVQKGAPRVDAGRSDDYRNWTGAIRGLFEVVGIPGGFNDPSTRPEEENEESEEWSIFLMGLHGRFGGKTFTAAELASLLKAHSLEIGLNPEHLPGDLIEKLHTPTFGRSLGRWLNNRVNTWAGQYVVRKASKDAHSKVQRYRVERNEA